jgi:PhzF family phenazine biosynthesis protein
MKIVQVDAFTDQPFGGNPAAVCVLEGPADPGWMQSVALEMNLSETAFLHPEPGQEAGTYRLRWFTPTTEVDLCGHATLATSHVLWTDCHLPIDRPARFLTRSGLLTAHRTADGWIEMDFPAEPIEPIADRNAVVGILDLPITFAGRNRMDLLVEVPDEAAVRAYVPDATALASIPVRGVILTARASEPPYDFVSRFFAPNVGVLEDPVCGSAHCALTPHWAGKLGRLSLLGHQVSPRGGVIRVRLEGDRVAIAGQAVVTLRGDLMFGPPSDPTD